MVINGSWDVDGTRGNFAKTLDSSLPTLIDPTTLALI